MTTTLAAYHGNIAEKRLTLKHLRAHRAADEIVQGLYWEGNGTGRGCAVGCLTHHPSGGHDQFPERWGIPENIAYLIDHIFESLPVDDAKDWPVRFMSAVPVGADLSGVWDRWCVWMLHRLIDKSPVAIPEVEVMASLFHRVVAGDGPSDTEWARAARAARAAWVAEAARAARAAEAAWVAEVARAARAAWAAEAARAAEAAWAARAARAARAAWAAARNEWARAAANELVRIVKSSPA